MADIRQWLDVLGPPGRGSGCVRQAIGHQDRDDQCGPTEMGPLADAVPPGSIGELLPVLMAARNRVQVSLVPLAASGHLRRTARMLSRDEASETVGFADSLGWP